MKNSKVLKEEKGSAIEAMSHINDLATTEARALTQEENDRFESLKTQVENINSAIVQAERSEFVNDLRSTTATTIVPEKRAVQNQKNDFDNAFRSVCLRGTPLDRKEFRDACDRVGLNAHSGAITLEMRAGQTTTTNTEGGHGVNGAMVIGVENALKSYGGVRGVASLQSSSNGAPLKFLTCNDTSNTCAVVGQNVARTSTDLVFGTVSLDAYTYCTNVFPVSMETIADVNFDISSFIAGNLGTRLARGTNVDYTTGNGSNKATGFITQTTAGKTTASATAITGNELIDLYHSVDDEYRGNAVWMMNDATFAYIRKLTDSVGKYLWGNGLNGGQEVALLGKRVVINNSMASIATAQKVIAFGDFGKFYIRDAGQVTIKVLQERYADQGAVGFMAFMRTDSKLVDAGTNPIKHLVMA